MDELAEKEGVAASLARLKTNAVLAMTTGGEKVVSRAEIERLDSIAAQIVGKSLDSVEFVPCGSGPKPDGPIFKALRERLPEREASGVHEFLVDLHGRIHGWFNH